MAFVLLTGDCRLFGLYFYEGKEKVDAEKYKNLLTSKVFPAMKARLGQGKFSRLIWQQDGAPCHTATPVIDYLDRIFGDRMLALKSPRGQDMSPQSPDLNPCEIFLWGHLKERVYKPMPQNMQDLKRRIKEVLQEVSCHSTHL